ncbi:MAG: hypothetical protein LBL66_10170 [Clostridiales bacterium]|nr:hypothetical protein [Clostridiales bacterium]
MFFHDWFLHFLVRFVFGSPQLKQCTVHSFGRGTLREAFLCSVEIARFRAPRNDLPCFMGNAVVHSQQAS